MESPSSWNRAIEELLRGKESADKLRDLFLAEASLTGDSAPSADDLVARVLRSFVNTISILRRAESDDHDEVSQVPTKACVVKSEESEESSRSSAPRDRRGSYRRRKNSDTFVKETPAMVDDGHQWRKYGQKSILNTQFPRHYYRCTHKTDQECPATKQVQMISENPRMYRTIYQGRHTCRNLIHKAPQIILDAPASPGNSSILLSFDGNLNTQQHNPFTTSSWTGLSPSVKQENREQVPGDLACSNDYTTNSNLSSSPSDYYAVFDSAGEISALSSDHGDVMSSSHSFDMGIVMPSSDFDEFPWHAEGN